MTINLTIPRSWKEVTLPQLRILARHSLRAMPREESATALFCKLAGVKIINQPSLAGKAPKDGLLCRDRKGHKFIIHGWQMSEFARMLDWYFDEVPVDIVTPARVDRQLMETTFGRYFHADALLFAAQNGGGKRMVRRALADLGDHRLHLSDAEAVAVMMWWKGFKQWLIDQYPDVFIAPEEDKGKHEAPGLYSPIKIRQNIMLLLNDGHPQDNDAIENSNVHDVLSALQHQIEVAKKEEEMMKKYRN